MLAHEWTKLWMPTIPWSADADHSVLKLFIEKSMDFRLNQLDTLSELSLNEDILRAFGESSLAEARPWKPTNTVRGSCTDPTAVTRWKALRVGSSATRRLATALPKKNANFVHCARHAPGKAPLQGILSCSLARAAQTEAERVDWIHPVGVGCVCVRRRFGLGGERRAFPRQRETSLECRSSAKPRCWCSEASTCDVFKAARYPSTE